MPVLEWRQTARADLLAIVEYISDDNPDAAQRLKDDIEAKAAKLPEHPKLYRAGRVARHAGNGGAVELRRDLHRGRPRRDHPARPARGAAVAARKQVSNKARTRGAGQGVAPGSPAIVADELADGRLIQSTRSARLTVSASPHCGSLMQRKVPRRCSL